MAGIGTNHIGGPDTAAASHAASSAATAHTAAHHHSTAAEALVVGVVAVTDDGDLVAGTEACYHCISGETDVVDIAERLSFRNFVAKTEVASDAG